jgi:hypothetical protein
MNRRHMIADHHARGTERATLLVRAVDGVLGTHSRRTRNQARSATCTHRLPPGGIWTALAVLAMPGADR